LGLPDRARCHQGPSVPIADPDSYPVEGRGVTYTMAFFSTKRSGVGQFYLMTLRTRTDKTSPARIPIG
jgi:hypothetical protein